MTAADTLRDRAKILGWDTHCDHSGDTFLRGENMVTVGYRRDGTVDNAKRYHFFTINNVVFAEEAVRDKRQKVVGWFAEYS